MGISLKVEHLKRYRDLAAFFWKHGRSDLVQQAGLAEALEPPADGAPPDGAAEQLAADLEQLGPTFVKLGQLLSTRADLVPSPYLEALARLQDDVAPFPSAEAEEIVAAELGVRVSKAFAEFDSRPLAAASLGQVHRAALRDGRPVAVKVQRPGIRARIVEDLEVLGEVAAFAERHTEWGRRYTVTETLQLFRKTLLAELDYRQEARNLAILGENLREFDRLVVPVAVEDYTTSRVLTTTFIPGRKVTALAPVARTELAGHELADQLFRAYLKQVLVDGFVHADPHPGNVFLTDDDRIALLDLGMVARVAPELQEKLLELLLAVSQGRPDQAAAVAISIGQPGPEHDAARFRRRVAEVIALNQDRRVEDLEVGRTVLMLARASGECGLRVPPELALLGKALLNLDQVGRALDPKFDPNAAVRGAAMDLVQRRMRKSLSPSHFFGSLLEAKELAEKLPGRINRILETVAANELKLNVDALDEKLLMEGFQKVANRITMGLVLAALIVGASMLMRVGSAAGHPGPALVLFLAAAGAGTALVISIFLSDRRKS
jgi:ubiquinone biosynthesis protein